MKDHKVRAKVGIVCALNRMFHVQTNLELFTLTLVL